MHSPKRRRVDPEEDKMDEDDENYVPYVPVAKRKQALVSKLTERKTETPAQKAKREQEEREEAEDAEKEEERLREKARKERTLLEEAQDVHKRKAEEDSKKSEAQKAAEEDEKILQAIASRRKLRELASQTYENVLQWTAALRDDGYPALNTLLCMGGISMADQSQAFMKGLHIVVATPGRLIDMLDKKRFTFDCCKYLCMDEADRMVDLGFEDDVRKIMSFFKHQRQTLLFSATMPRKIQDFAQQSLTKPILVNVGRAGAANLDVLQVVEYVKQEAKMVYLLECLQKTPPPVIIFSDNKNEVDDIQEYLLLKGVEAVAIHGSKTQEERQYAIKSFKAGKKDVMVASGVASKGLDFAEIQHVINFTMPKEIEDYVHQIGRTGRSGKTGIATTFVNMNTPEQTLLDLKYLLMEAKQKVPPFLMSIEDPRAAQGASLTGCPVCGGEWDSPSKLLLGLVSHTFTLPGSGLGHGISNCPKLEDNQRRQMAAHRGGDIGGY
ncbi:DEAD-box ATP-dependent RNA helicase 35 [Tulasnella sp. 417]|nr:DEAD-box ATP-dependent RNA helicase 35 [Tulasnella sp. 417]